MRAERVHELRWWTPQDLLAASDCDDIVFAPRALPALVASLVSDGPPDSPLEVGV